MFGQQEGRLLLCYFFSWLVKGAHGLDLPGIVGVSWLRLARMSTNQSLQKSTGRRCWTSLAPYFWRGGGDSTA
jgi:hypothetical protein